ncbi:hypothetical protein D3C75_1240450 [compost metagenome]
MQALERSDHQVIAVSHHLFAVLYVLTQIRIDMLRCIMTLRIDAHIHIPPVQPLFAK